MNITPQAVQIAADVLRAFNAESNEELAGELRRRVESAYEHASQLFLNGLTGDDTETDAALVASRFQSLRAAGAVAAADAYTDGFRNLVLRVAETVIGPVLNASR